ncbi:MAG TPA: MMPL family transporter [Streptosporangiaceae bacterium]
MFEAWGRFVYRRRRWVLSVGLVAIAFAAIWGTGVFGALTSSGGFETPGSNSDKAATIAERALGRGGADVVVMYRSQDRKVDDPAYRAAVTRALAALPPDKVAGTTSYWSTGASRFVSADRRSTYAIVRLTGADDQARRDDFDAVSGALRHVGGLAETGITVRLGGYVPTAAAVNDSVSRDIGRAESLAMPALLVLLVVIFGGLVAASLPLAIGAIAILGSFTALRLLTLGTDVSIFAVNITTFLGLGLAIDYGLFMVARFREELATANAAAAGTGDDPAGAVPSRDATHDALARTMATAGRTVAVSGVTVAVSLAGLTLVPQMFLRSMGYGGVATVLTCMLAALTVLPALLAVLGPRVNALSLGGRRGRAGARGSRAGRPSGAGAPPPGGGAWYRLASSVMRRPVRYVVATVALLLALGAPFLHVSWGGVDGRVLPAGTEARVVTETLDHDFQRNATTPIDVIVTGRTDPAAFAGRLERVPGVLGAQVTGVRTAGPDGPTARISLRYSTDPMSTATRDIVVRVRDLPAPHGTHVYVGGMTAELVDQMASLGAVLPWVGLAIGLSTFVLLFLAFGSVVLPLKAIAMNILSLSAAFGVVVWIFQDGHLSGLLDFTATGAIGPAMPILMFAMLFGLSMDYEVFLLSRVREEYDLTGANTAAVAAGLQRTGGIITSAALLFLIVIGAFSTSGISFIKMIGVGMAVALLVDATVVRAVLVPATMRLLGRVNWWAPGPLRRLYRRYGIREAADAPAAPEPVATLTAT